LADVDLRQLAKKVRAKGRGRDTVLAHITPQEAALLKARGGRGSINPDTGLPEFEDDFADFGGGIDQGFAEYAPEPAPAPSADQLGQDTRRAADVANIGQAQPQAPPPSDQVAGGAPGSTMMGAYNATGQQAAEPLSASALQYGQSPEALAGTATAAGATGGGGTNQGFLQQLLGGLGIGGLGNIGGSDLARLGLAGAGLGMGLQARSAAQQQAQAAQKQIQNIANVDQQRAAALQAQMAGTAGDVAARAAPAQEAIQALATPYQQQGSQQAQQALAGALSPMSAQSLQAAQAQQAQAQARSGGVGAAQAGNQLEALRQALLSNQYQQGLATQQIGDRYAQSGITTGLAQGNLGSQYSNLAATTGLQASGIADQYTLRAIQAGLAGNQQAQQLSQQYFQALGSILGGTPALRAQPATTTPGA
jgi:hypothetical protein